MEKLAHGRRTVSRWGRAVRLLFVVCVTLQVTACGASRDQEETADRPAAHATEQPAAAPATQPPRLEVPAHDAPATAEPPQREWRSSLADLLQEAEQENQGRRGTPFSPAAYPEIDDARVAVAGIRKLQGKHLTLYTDLPAQPAVDELPRVFDLAVPQWCAYFGVDPAQVADWRMWGYVMDRKEAFAATGLLPDDLPRFLHGFQRGYELWLYEQPSDYYRRHLLLHEGVHAFMTIIGDGAGPPWYAEGMAELLGTHQWREGALTVNRFPPRKEETPMWGRVKIVQDEYAAHRGLTLPRVFELGPRAHLELEPYGWSWAAAAFLDGNPRTQAAFRALREQVRLGEPNFSRHLRDALGDEWLHTVEEWQLFVAKIDYGYDLRREAVEYGPGSLLPTSGQTVTVAADRGWQSSGVRVESGKTYRVTAAGRYTVAQLPKPWECEPNGVTIRYHGGLPLGMLLGAVRPESFSEGQASAFLQAGALGTGRTIRAPTTGVLYFRINDSPAELADNEGTLSIRIEPAS